MDSRDRSSGLHRMIIYTLYYGAAGMGGWMFVVFCFAYSINGVALRLDTLELLLGIAIGCGMAWGGFMGVALPIALSKLRLRKKI